MTVRPLRGIHVFWMVFAFFALVIGVDILFVVRAVGSFPGEDAPNSYLLGLDYNTTLARRAEQQELGWRVEAGIDNGAALVVRIRDRSGEPLAGLDVSAEIHWIGKPGDAAPVRIVERRPGEYAAPFELAEGSRVRLLIEARRKGEDEVAFEASKTLAAP